MSACMSASLRMWRFFLPGCQPVWILSVCQTTEGNDLSVCLCVCGLVCLACLFVCMFVYISVCLSAPLFRRLTCKLSVCLPAITHMVCTFFMRFFSRLSPIYRFQQMTSCWKLVPDARPTVEDLINCIAEFHSNVADYV